MYFRAGNSRCYSGSVQSELRRKETNTYALILVLREVAMNTRALPSLCVGVVYSNRNPPPGTRNVMPGGVGNVLLVLFSMPLKRSVSQTVCTVCTRINYTVVPVTKLNKYLQYGTSGIE